MPVKHLQLVSRVSRPNAASLVAARCDDLVSLRIELYFTDFIFVALEERSASASEDIINARQTVRACGRKFVSGTVEASVEHFIVMTPENLDALSCADVPEPASPVDATCQAVVACKVKLTTRKLALVSLKREQALPRADIPDFGGVVK